MTEKKIVPVWEKYALTTREASLYFEIGEKKLREIVRNNMDGGFFIWNGSKLIIKRKLFEQFLDGVSVV